MERIHGLLVVAATGAQYLQGRIESWRLNGKTSER